MARLLLLSLALFAVALAQQPIGLCPGPNDVFINVAGKQNAQGARCDVPAWLKTAGTKQNTFNAVVPPATGTCGDIYKTARWSLNGKIDYEIPVPAGTYQVYLFFAEVYKFAVVGTRVMKITVNGNVLETNFDILTKVSAINTPYLYNAGQQTATNSIKVVLEGAGPNLHPVLSGIGIASVGGSKPDGIVGQSGVAACTVAPAPPSSAPAPSAPASVPSPSAAAAPQPGPTGIIGSCPGPDDVAINAGGENVEGFRCDDPFAMTGNKFMPPNQTKVDTPGCFEPFKSHRWLPTGDLMYDVKVPAGTYTVDLLFAENYNLATVGFRQFTVSVGNTPVQVPGTTGTTFDIFALSGMNPYAVRVADVTPVDGSIKVTVSRVKQNPFLSGIIIRGTGTTKANGVIQALGSTSCTGTQPADPSTAPGTSAAASVSPASVAPVVTPTPGLPAAGQPGSCPGPNDVAINAGGENVEDFRCDDPFAMTGNKFMPPNQTKVDSPGCFEPFKSHRWIFTGDLVYDVKVPAGTYTVDLMFAENFDQATVGFRQFKVNVGTTAVQVPGTTGTTFDIFALSGMNPYVVQVPNVSPVDGSIKVTIARVKQNPFLSGIIIRGTGTTNADGVVGALGTTSCTGTAPVTTSPVAAPPITTDPPATDASVGVCPGNTDVFVNAGGENIEGFRCDDPFVSIPSNKFNPNTPKPAVAGCVEAYKSHRWLNTGPSLDYTFKVPAGTYTVYLMFMENFSGASVGFRTFKVKVGNTQVPVPNSTDTTFDVFALKGLNEPLMVTVENVAPIAGNIVVSVERVTQNPFISGIGIKGNGAVAANAEVKDLGLTSCSANPNPAPVCDLNKPADSNFTGVHSAHAVTGGPYSTTDFDKSGRQAVTLDALRSHSHGTDSQGKQIVITNWIWSWNDPGNPKADSSGKVTIEGFAPVEEFPVGKTQIELRAVDSACDIGLDVSEVTVNPSTKKGAYCYFYDFGTSTSTTVPIPEDITLAQRPVYGVEAGDINYAGANPFGFLKFSSNAIAVRCVYIIDLAQPATIGYKFAHDGPIVVSKDGVVELTGTGSTTKTLAPKLYPAGMHKWQIRYFRPAGVAGKLQLLGMNDAVLTDSQIGHDAGSTIPVITSVSKTTAVDGTDITISGTAFVNDVMVLFGSVEGETLDTSAGTIIVRIPPVADSTVVDLVVKTNAGTSNAIKFTYAGGEKSCLQPGWQQTTLKQNGQDYPTEGVAVLSYGPDGRLYLGTLNQKVIVLKHDKNLNVQTVFDKTFPTGCKCKRAVLGLNFDPRESASSFSMYFSSSVIFWSKDNRIPTLEAGWKNGKIHKVPVTPDGPFGAITDLITGLPVSNHDHAVNAILFPAGPDNAGKILIGIGGFTNGGISEPNDLLGGVPGSQLSGAYIECPKSGVDLVYSNPGAPAQSAIISNKKCTVYAAGFRNSFGSLQHTNGAIYASENGPNQQFGKFSTDCVGGFTGGQTFLDRLYKLEKGNCHGFPNIPRALATNDQRQCIYDHPQCVTPIVDNLSRSSNGVVEYRSNLYDGEFKGDLFVTRFSNTGASKGTVQRIQLKADGTAANVNLKFWGDSGVSVVEGPRGEMVMARVYKSSFFVLKPVCKSTPTNTYLIGVHPKAGPSAGGQKVLISGFGFGTTPTASFGTKPCTNVQSIDDTQFTCVTPAGATNQQVKVTVTGTTGPNEDTKGSDFWYY